MTENDVAHHEAATCPANGEARTERRQEAEFAGPSRKLAHDGPTSADRGKKLSIDRRGESQGARVGCAVSVGICISAPDPYILNPVDSLA
jgi:hypothetical protein